MEQRSPDGVFPSFHGPHISASTIDLKEISTSLEMNCEFLRDSLLDIIFIIHIVILMQIAIFLL